MGCVNSEHVPKPSKSNNPSFVGKRSIATDKQNFLPGMEPAATYADTSKPSPAKSEEPEVAPEPIGKSANSSIEPTWKQDKKNEEEVEVDLKPIEEIAEQVLGVARKTRPVGQGRKATDFEDKKDVEDFLENAVKKGQDEKEVEEFLENVLQDIKEEEAVEFDTTQITLHDFDIFGKGEAIRSLLTYLQLPFSYHHISFEEWPDYKNSGECEFGQLPMLEYNDKKLVGSRAIMQFIASLHNMYPTDPKEIYLAESIIDQIDDIMNATLEHMLTKQDPEFLEQYKEKKLPSKLNVIDTRLQKSTTDYFVGESAGLADITVLTFVYYYFMQPKQRETYLAVLETNAPKVKEWAEGMLERHHGLKSYFETRSADNA